MPTNPFFNNINDKPEQKLLQELTIESIQINGVDAYYIPRVLVDVDNIFNEDRLSKFINAFPLELYIESTENYLGDGDMLGKFGHETREIAEFLIAKKRFTEVITTQPRPNEGDLIYNPVSKNLWEIKYVDPTHVLYQLGSLYTYKCTVELFEYSSQVIETGVDEIDLLDTEFSSFMLLAIDEANTIGTFVANSDIYMGPTAAWQDSVKIGKIAKVYTERNQVLLETEDNIIMEGTSIQTLASEEYPILIRVNDMKAKITAGQYIFNAANTVSAYVHDVRNAPIDNFDGADNQLIQDVASVSVNFDEDDPFSEGLI